MSKSKLWVGLAAALSLAAAPCAAADLRMFEEVGSHRSGGVARAYVRLPLGGTDGGPSRPEAGLRLSAAHAYGNASGTNWRVVEADTLDLRLNAKAQPTLFLAGQPMTGPEADERLSALSTGEKVAIVVAGIAVVGVAGYYVLRHELKGD